MQAVQRQCVEIRVGQMEFGFQSGMTHEILNPQTANFQNATRQNMLEKLINNFSKNKSNKPLRKLAAAIVSKYWHGRHLVSLIFNKTVVTKTEHLRSLITGKWLKLGFKVRYYTHTRDQNPHPNFLSKYMFYSVYP